MNYLSFLLDWTVTKGSAPYKSAHPQLATKQPYLSKIGARQVLEFATTN